MDKRRKNLWKSWIAAGIFAMSMSAISGLSEKDSAGGLTERETVWKWLAVGTFLISCPFVWQIKKWPAKDPPDAP